MHILPLAHGASSSPSGREGQGGSLATEQRRKCLWANMGPCRGPMLCSAPLPLSHAGSWETRGPVLGMGFKLDTYLPSGPETASHLHVVGASGESSAHACRIVPPRESGDPKGCGRRTPSCVLWVLEAGGALTLLRDQSSGHPGQGSSTAFFVCIWFSAQVEKHVAVGIPSLPELS